MGRQLVTAVATKGNVTTAAKKEEEHHEEEEGELFPLPYVLFFVGYTIVLIVDKLIGGHKEEPSNLGAAGHPNTEAD